MSKTDNVNSYNRSVINWVIRISATPPLLKVGDVMVKRNYINMIGKLNDGFGDTGWADGFADMPSDHDEIISQLYDKIEKEDLISYLGMYLQGYDLGNFMSEECEEIYDEDGCLKEGVNLDTCPQEHYARQLVLNYKRRK